MPTIAHLSDVHFGREDPQVVEALIAHLHDDPPDLTAVSGDFTQRARAEQFQAAAAFYNRLPAPRLAVPGNHDVPLFNLFARAFRPFDNYQRYIVQTLRPVYDDGQVCVVGINTARRMGRRWKGFWKDGIIRGKDLAFACTTFAMTTAPVRVLVAHHPLQVAHEAFHGDVVRAGKAALRRLAAVGCDAILYGHIHVPHAVLGAEHATQLPRSMLCVMAGTATSNRLRLDTPNSYNRVWFDGERCVVDVYAFDGKRFARTTSDAFTRDAKGWSPVKTDQPSVQPAEPGASTTDQL